MYEAVAVTNQSVVYAGIGGFAEKINWLTRDYFFVVEVYWSDNRTTFVKRTYSDFVKFHAELSRYFRAKYETGDIKSPQFIPRLEGGTIAGLRWFRWNSREMAEEREHEIHNFLKQLLQGNPMISGSQVVVDFFKSRHTDPVPVREPPEGASAEDKGRHNSLDDDSDEDHILFNR